MKPSQILAIVLIVIGIGLLVTGYNASQAPTEQIAEAVTGRFSDETSWYLILGVAGIVAGALWGVFGRRR